MFVGTAPHELEQAGLFEEFFEVCQTPNAAEVEFLSRVSGLAEDEVQLWCKCSQQQSESGRSNGGFIVDQRRNSVQYASMLQHVGAEGPSVLVEPLLQRGITFAYEDEELLG
jgi:hypothetical protein